MDTIDVIIIGSGIAGLSAALSATENGARTVVVFEADTEIGGASRLSGGIIMGAGYGLQREAGVEDSAESFYRDYMNANVWNLNPAAVKAFCDESGPTIDWLVGHGVRFHPDLIFGGAENTPRCVAAVGQGGQIVNGLARKVRQAGVDIAVDHRVERILFEDGRAVGVVVGGEEIRSASVVIASGGYGANRELLAEHNPSWTATGDWGWYIGTGTAQGDAFGFAEQLGARIDGHDRGLRLLHPGFVRTFESYIPGWMVLVNKEGRRFVDESSAYGVLDRTTHSNGGVAWFVFDHQAVDRSTAGNTKAYKQVMPEREDRQSPNWNPAMIAEQVEAGRIHSAGTVAQLAVKAGLPVDQLQATVEAYNDGDHDAFGKDAQFVRPITEGPFYAAEVRLATLCWTGVGPAVTGRGEVMDTLGRPIPGAYACGEVTGGVLGDVYVGSGNSVGNSATFGRIAGRNAALSIAGVPAATSA
ncbi:FAD-dependent oxidoreductase [Actinomadura sp. KC345]|uniref:FAD-dependent oxidoreductase n=1 Tax=Actinomadura sp. KC345 TaxID=2530371 RepID=UPI001047E211|nr:FAD-dependent oxidoreductase [Actinomadura sp. KC345]TDC55488.1 FAD-dependent oxidoreductase [Actinomadura sp. KC345]